MEKQTDYSSLSSSATHRTTQPSTTLNRKYVKRPVVQRIVRDGTSRESSTPVTHIGASNKLDAPVLSSRLVNMHIRAPKPEPRKINLADIPKPLPTFSEDELVEEFTEEVIEEEVEPMTQPETIPQTSLSAPEIMSKITAQPEENSINMEDKYRDSIHISHATPPIMREQPVEPKISYTPQSVESQTPNYSVSPMISRFSEPTPTVNFTSPLLSQNNNYEDNYKPQASIPEPVEKVIPENADPASKESIEAIARAAAAAIASIHNATEPSEVYAEMDKLKRTAAVIQKEDHKEIKPKLEVKSKEEIGISKLKKAAEESTAISINSKKSAKAKPATNISVKNSKSPSSSTHRVVKNTAPKIKTRSNIEPSPAELKDKAIRNALRSMADVDHEPEVAKKSETKVKGKPEKQVKAKSAPRPAIKRKHSGRRFILAFACAAACVAMIVRFVSSNIPDISVKVAALQTGIQASYPSYVPREFSLQDIASENGRIVINFASDDGKTFSLIEEKSSWDSSALVRNYVEPNWQSDYTTTHEQGITIYVSNSNAAWVNGGVLYKITAAPNVLTTKQLRNIVTSL